MQKINKIIDTNVIIRFLIWDSNDVLFERSVEIMNKIENEEIYVYLLESVVVECIYVLVKFYKIPKNDVINDLKQILYLNNVINENKNTLIEGLNIYSLNNIDFVDCLIEANAILQWYEIITFDKKINNLKK